MDFVQAVKEGLNQVAVEENDLGYILTLTHNASNDNAVTCFVLKTDVVLWSDYEDDDEFEKAVDNLGTYEDQYAKTMATLQNDGSESARNLMDALQNITNAVSQEDSFDVSDDEIVDIDELTPEVTVSDTEWFRNMVPPAPSFPNITPSNTLTYSQRWGTDNNTVNPLQYRTRVDEWVGDEE